jgi:hypothetical protein
VTQIAKHIKIIEIRIFFPLFNTRRVSQSAGSASRHPVNMDHHPKMGGQQPNGAN